MKERDVCDVKVIQFSPEHWGHLDRFQHFYSTTYKFDDLTTSALRGVASQFNRARRLLSLAHRIAPTLQEDLDELKAKGYSRSIRSKELAAVIEAFFSGIYSSIDCARQVVGKVFKGFQGVTSNSTRRLFQNASDGKLDDRLPAGIREAFTNVPWYRELRRIRDAVSHSDVGSCHMNEKIGKIFYMNNALGGDGRAMVVEDIMAKMDETIKAVNKFLGLVFRDLNATLKDELVWQMCGIFGGRVYSRLVRPSEAVDFHSGICDAYHWFELAENPTCPFAETCIAYKQVRRADSAADNL